MTKDYRESQATVLDRAENRLADIDTCITEGDTTADWAAERKEQLRLIARIKKGRF